MSTLSSPPRFLPPISPRRAPSPNMSPGGRRGRTLAPSEETHLRDLSPHTTLRAFTERPMPHDISRDEYKIFACIDNLTAAERDLGARVAKAAQRLKSWCQEIEQWGWSGSFEQPSEDYREKRRKSLELRIKEHVKDTESVDNIGPLEYWGSLLSVEVQAHEARLDEIGDELLSLDIEELKEHVLDIHGPDRSRPSSSGYEASRQNYLPLDDFSFLITQTLLSALPNHFRLKDRLNTWTARVSILREAPRYVSDLKTAQRAMRLGWEAIEPPSDSSDTTTDKWKEAVETISDVLQGKVSDLGQRLDRMLDTLEGREDCLPDDWIDSFEQIEADYGRWAHESRKRVMDFDLRRRSGRRKDRAHMESIPEDVHAQDDDSKAQTPAYHQATVSMHTGNAPVQRDNTIISDTQSIAIIRTSPEPRPSESSVKIHEQQLYHHAEPENDHLSAEESDFEDGDTVIHNDLDHEEPDSSFSESIYDWPSSTNLPESLSTTSAVDDPVSSGSIDRPQTPRIRRDSLDSISSDVSIMSSPASVGVDSPSVRNKTNHQARAPKPELNAAMGKRRPLNITKDSNINSSMESAPWPPTQFSKQLSPNSADDLERKISDILTTIPAHIRLTSGPRSTTPEVRRARGGLPKKGSKGYLRATRSINGLKSPELTLSPAKPEDSSQATSGRKSATALRNDNDIKLYHLTQPGKEHPIKLFIRRVGENGERVMVRVGGGWADLGEYLRQYAEHHGRRTVSDGKFEILGLEARNTDSPRPESAMSKGRSRRPSAGSHVGSPNTTPKKTVAPVPGRDEIPPVPSLTTTPIATGGEASAPSTGSSRHSWTGNEVGLAGPKARKLDLSGEKLDWIEGMMKQARTVSGSNVPTASRSEQTPSQQREGVESRSDSRSGARKQHEFADLGKFGGTKRVFLRGGKLSEH